MKDLPYEEVKTSLTSGESIPAAVMQAFRTALAGLRPHLAAQVYMNLSQAGCMDIEIAAIAGRSLRHVKTLLEFSKAPTALVDMVANRKASIAAAHKAMRVAESTGQDVMAVIQEAAQDEDRQKKPRKDRPVAAAKAVVRTLLKAKVPSQLRACIAGGADIVQIRTDDAQRLLHALEQLAPTTRRRA